MRTFAALLLLAIVAGFVGLRAWGHCFTTWHDYDDQGYFMLAARHMLAGHAPYDEFPFLHGPAYFAWRWLLHGVCAVPLTVDAVRLVTASVWLVVSIAGAAFAWNSAPSVRLAAALAALALGGGLLEALAGEPGHSQELVLLLVASAVLAAPWLARARPERGALVLGLVAGAMVATKINVGALFVVAMLAHLLSRAGLAPRGRALLLVALGLLPFVVLRADLGQVWAPQSAATAALVWIGLALRPPPAASTGWRPLGAFALGGLASYGALLGFVLTRGSSLAGVLRSTVLDPLLLPSILHMFTGWFAGALPLAALGFALLVLLRVAPPALRDAWTPRLAIAGRLGLAAAWFGQGVWGSYPLLSYGPACLPLALLPLDGRAQQLDGARQLVAWIAVTGVLQVYPVSGTQCAIAAWPLLVLSLVLALELVPHALRGRAQLAEGLALLGCAALSFPALRAGRDEFSAWQSSRWHLDLPGTHLLTMQPGVRLRMRWMARNLEAHSSSFVAAWSTNSLYFWTTRPPPTLDVVSHAWQLVPRARQELLIAALEREPAPFVALRTGLLDEAEQLELPFPKYLRERYRTEASYRGFELLVPRERAPVELIDCAWLASVDELAALPASLQLEARAPGRCLLVVAPPLDAAGRRVAAVRCADVREIDPAVGTDLGPAEQGLRLFDERGVLLLGDGAATGALTLSARTLLSLPRSSVIHAVPPLRMLIFRGAPPEQELAYVPIVERPRAP